MLLLLQVLKSRIARCASVCSVDLKRKHSRVLVTAVKMFCWYSGLYVDETAQRVVLTATVQVISFADFCYNLQERLKQETYIGLT